MTNTTPFTNNNTCIDPITNAPDSTIHVFGHQTPDTDAIAAAIVMSDWLSRQGINATAHRLGECNLETEWLLAWADVAPPPLVTKLPQGSNVALVDHNESSQSIDGLTELNVRYVIDHHRLGDLHTAAPLYAMLRPVGSTCTILLEMYDALANKQLHAQAQSQQVDVTKSLITPTLAKLMLGAVISDTLNLTSPTTTSEDKEAVQRLAEMVNLSEFDSSSYQDLQSDTIATWQRQVNAFAQAMWLAKSRTDHLSAEALILSDFKRFSFTHGAHNTSQTTQDKPIPQSIPQSITLGIGCIETVLSEAVLGRLDELVQAAPTVIESQQLDCLLIAVVDIMAGHAWLICPQSEWRDNIILAFSDVWITSGAQQYVLNDGTVITHPALLGKANIVSRKLDMVPRLTKYFASDI